MSSVKLSIELNGNRDMVVIRAQTETGDQAEERCYFLDPYASVEFANTMLHLAEECGVEIQMQTTGISDVKRLRLIKRCEHVIRSLSGRKLPYMASQVVDTILAEVL
jgi:hypothetical protein